MAKRRSKKRLTSRGGPPATVRGVEACIAVTENGVTVYGNRAAMRSISRWAAWIAESDPAEHDELHVVWHLRRHFAKRKNVWVLFEKAQKRGFRFSRQFFDVTLMAVERHDLDAMRRHQRRGILPATWGKQ